METPPKVLAHRSGQRHGDSLSDMTRTPIREVIGDEEADKVANALRFMAMQTQIRRETGLSKWYDSLARFFDAGRAT